MATMTVGGKKYTVIPRTAPRTTQPSTGSGSGGTGTSTTTTPAPKQTTTSPTQSYYYNPRTKTYSTTKIAGQQPVSKQVALASGNKPQATTSSSSTKKTDPTQQAPPKFTPTASMVNKIPRGFEEGITKQSEWDAEVQRRASYEMAAKPRAIGFSGNREYYETDPATGQPVKLASEQYQQENRYVKYTSPGLSSLQGLQLSNAQGIQLTSGELSLEQSKNIKASGNTVNNGITDGATTPINWAYMGVTKPQVGSITPMVASSFASGAKGNKGAQYQKVTEILGASTRPLTSTTSIGLGKDTQTTYLKEGTYTPYEPERILLTPEELKTKKVGYSAEQISDSIYQRGKYKYNGDISNAGERLGKSLITGTIENIGEGATKYDTKSNKLVMDWKGVGKIALNIAVLRGGWGATAKTVGWGANVARAATTSKVVKGLIGTAQFAGTYAGTELWWKGYSKITTPKNTYTLSPTKQAAYNEMIITSRKISRENQGGFYQSVFNSILPFTESKQQGYKYIAAQAKEQKMDVERTLKQAKQEQQIATGKLIAQTYNPEIIANIVGGVSDVTLRASNVYKSAPILKRAWMVAKTRFLPGAGESVLSTKGYLDYYKRIEIGNNIKVFGKTLDFGNDVTITNDLNFWSTKREGKLDIGFISVAPFAAAAGMASAGTFGGFEEIVGTKRVGKNIVRRGLGGGTASTIGYVPIEQTSSIFNPIQGDAPEYWGDVLTDIYYGANKKAKIYTLTNIGSFAELAQTPFVMPKKSMIAIPTLTKYNTQVRINNRIGSIFNVDTFTENPLKQRQSQNDLFKSNQPIRFNTINKVPTENVNKVTNDMNTMNRFDTNTRMDTNTETNTFVNVFTPPPTIPLFFPLPDGGGGSSNFSFIEPIRRKTQYTPSLYGLSKKKRAKRTIIDQVLTGLEVRYSL
jgi:hypothetical protein